MTSLQKLSVNVETGEETLIDLTADEVAAFQASVKPLKMKKQQFLLRLKAMKKLKQQHKQNLLHLV